MDSGKVKRKAEGFMIPSMGKGPMKQGEIFQDLLDNEIIQVDSQTNC